MRELLFRGFHPCDGPDTIVVDGEKVKGRWVEGDFLPDSNGDTYITACKFIPMMPGFEKRTTLPISCNHPEEWVLSVDVPVFKVLPSTVGQYSGLKDKFVLRKIFEYDIIDSSSGEKVGNYYENKEILKRKSNFVVERMGTKKWRCSEQKAIKCGCGYAE